MSQEYCREVPLLLGFHIVQNQLIPEAAAHSLLYSLTWILCLCKSIWRPQSTTCRISDDLHLKLYRLLLVPAVFNIVNFVCRLLQEQPSLSVLLLVL